MSNRGSLERRRKPRGFTPSGHRGACPDVRCPLEGDADTRHAVAAEGHLAILACWPSATEAALDGGHYGLVGPRGPTAVALSARSPGWLPGTGPVRPAAQRNAAKVYEPRARGERASATPAGAGSSADIRRLTSGDR